MINISNEEIEFCKQLAKGRFDRARERGSDLHQICLLYTSPSPRDVEESRMPSSA